ncbi:MAG: DNA polymerase III subunit gamma/tau [Clostridia bacterium]|nr:DNA polymerase III subunit gamma/tau [Clostridia bacterium]
MAHLALYRRYRPQTFSQVIGQEHITTILLHQLEQGQLSHAYLFCGSRGTGKTTTAKILSRAANCTNLKDGEPCGVCPNCEAALSDNSDILEIDAASNTSVDNVRDLIEQSQFMPLILKYRVFIIDEVHMLSNNAFNALLKTLEEPPAHVIFILATTEPHKLPATIISRCQRFDFHRLNSAHIIHCLQDVLGRVGASIEVEGLQLIAKAAEGGMRDALSLADQCLSFCGNKVTASDVYAVIGGVEQDVLFSLADALLSGDSRACIGAIDKTVSSGRDLTVFTNDLSAHIRALLITKSCGGGCEEVLDCTTDRMARYERQAKKYDEQLLLYALERLITAQGQLRYFPSPRTLVEATLVRICHPQSDEGFEALASRLAALEAQRAAPPLVQAPVAMPKTETEPAPEPEAKLDKESEPQPEAERPEPAKAEIAEAQAEAEPTEAQAALSDADEVWAAVLGRLQLINPMLHYSARSGRAVTVDSERLLVEFPMGNETAYDVLKAAKNFKQVQQAVWQVQENLTLSLRLEPSDGDVSELQELFGGKLIIE